MTRVCLKTSQHQEKSCRQSEHPCFGGDHHMVGRIHLPVAPGCNIKCSFCDRKHDCVNESRPGVTSKVLTPEQGLERVNLVKRHMDFLGGAELKVVGIAGPGDPLANPNTLKTLRLVRAAYPAMTLCLSTNGLRLAENLPKLTALGLHSLTVTINATTSETAARIYDWVSHDRIKMTGKEGAALLLEKQMAGVKLATDAGLMVKVNHVYIPGINDHETLPLASRVRDLGVDIMNIMPIIPAGHFQDIAPPSLSAINLIRKQAAEILPQAWHCKQCRADASGVIGRDINLEALEKQTA